MPDNKLVYVDTEFTNLDPLKGDVIEVAWAVDDSPVRALRFDHTLADADPKALEVNQYNERGFATHQITTTGMVPGHVTGYRDSAGWRQLKADLTDATIVAENYGIDWIKMFLKLGYEPWHYRKIELSSVALSVFDLDRPEGLHKTADRLRDLSWAIPEPDHTAAADVECLRACYLALRAIRSRHGYPKSIHELVR